MQRRALGMALALSSCLYLLFQPATRAAPPPGVHERANPVEGATLQGLIRTLSLRQALALALAHSPDLGSAHTEILAARGALTQSRLFSNPSFFIGSFTTEVSPPQAPIPNEFGFEWTVPIGGKRAAGIDAARADLSGVRHQFIAARRELVLSVQTAFVTVLVDRSRFAFATRERERFRREVKLNERRYEDGKIAYGEILKLRLQALVEDDAVREANEALDNARSDLRRLIGGHVLADRFTVRGTLAAPPSRSRSGIEALVRRALSTRPDYQALLARARSAAAEVRLAKRTPIPDLDVTLDYNREEHAAGNFDVLLTVPLPIFDHNQAGVTRAEAAQAKVQLAIDGLRLQVRSEVEKALAEWRTAYAEFDAYTDKIVGTAKQSLAISRHAYEVGSGSLLDYLDAESSYLEVENGYRAAIARTMAATFRLRFVSGEDQS